MSGDGDLGGDGSDIGVSVHSLVVFVVRLGDVTVAELAACDTRHVGCCFWWKMSRSWNVEEVC